MTYITTLYNTLASHVADWATNRNTAFGLWVALVASITLAVYCLVRLLQDRAHAHYIKSLEARLDYGRTATAIVQDALLSSEDGTADRWRDWHDPADPYRVPTQDEAKMLATRLNTGKQVEHWRAWAKSKGLPTLMTLAMVLGVIWGTCQPVQAQSMSIQERANTQDSGNGRACYLLSTVALGAANAFDLASSVGGYEANPMLGRGRFGGQQIGIKLGMVGAAIAVQAVIGHKWPGSRRAMCMANFAGAGVITWVGYRNLSARRVPAQSVHVTSN